MGKGTDKLYITHSEWSSSDAYSASVGSNARSRGDGTTYASFKRLPFNFCAASLQPFKNPVCTPSGTIFDVEVISAWLDKNKTNPVDGEPLAAKDLIRLNFSRNADTSAAGADDTDASGDFIDPVTFKVLTDNTHIVAVRHGAYANVFAWDTVERMNIKTKMWRDLLDDAEFTRKDIITLQDPQNAASRDLSQFQHLKDGGDALPTKEHKEQREQGNINIGALGRIGDKVLRAKEAVERARQARATGTDVNRTAKSASAGTNTTRAPYQSAIVEKKKLAPNAAAYTTGQAAASFTSTGLTPSTSGERAILSDEEWMLVPRRIKHKGYARLDTNLGPLTVELHTDTAPKAVWNFLRLAEKGYYRGVSFHRNIRNFMIQGGDPTGTGRGGQSIWGRTFADELEGPHVHDTRGVLSMANKGRNTNSSQFFITYRPAKHLDRKHTVFGRVVTAADGDASTGQNNTTTLNRMEAVPVEENTNRPLQDITIQDIVVLIDPFAEFLKDKKSKEDDAQAQEEIKRRGGTEDDRTTWTGKRLRDDQGNSLGRGDSDGGVGRYLKIAQQQGTEGKGASTASTGQGRIETWEEEQAPAKKRAKTGGGFGNFDGW
ncbi:cyclophilin-like domain-containing protein [Dichotomopilus funicola]|uniref:Peptidyl-prolyl cis-trans isomerase-like 2 n=1 Tax=Dichotomopilus funicola TaxID=1934379 RepID=A0AAN6ZPS0_9PEZI|nr:cyclophilin-like domain-containing protein [Dichotomopilus funicola]